MLINNNSLIKLLQKLWLSLKKYIDFNSVSDFYNAAWLKDFPQGTQVSATGLDDGAEEFYAVVQFKQQYLKFDIKENHSTLSFQNMNGETFKCNF